MDSQVADLCITSLIIACILITVAVLARMCLYLAPVHTAERLYETFNDGQLDQLDQLINASITCPYERLSCKKLCDGKVQIRYTLKDSSQEEIEIFENENDFIQTWNKLSNKYPSISKCINPLQNCEIETCPSSPVDKVKGQEEKQLLPDKLERLERRLKMIDKKLDSLKPYKRQVQKRDSSNSSSHDSDVVSDRADAKKISQNQLIEILNRLINKRYLRPDDYSNIMKDFHKETASPLVPTKKTISESYINYRDSLDGNLTDRALDGLDKKIAHYYNNIKKIHNKNLQADLDIYRKEFIKKSKSKIDSDYETIKDLLDRYRYELYLCRRYNDPSRSKAIDRYYKKDIDRLDNRFFEQLLQYQNLVKSLG